MVEFFPDNSFLCEQLRNLSENGDFSEKEVVRTCYLVSPLLIPARHPKSFNRNIPPERNSKSSLFGVAKSNLRNLADVGHD